MIVRPAISLIIATYNRGPLIARTLDSVLNQTWPPEEVVVVDDCSTDGTGDWVRSHYANVRVVRTPQNARTSGAGAILGRGSHEAKSWHSSTTTTS